MKRILFAFLLCSLNVFAQRAEPPNKYDSLGRMQGYWKLQSNVNYINYKKHFGGVEGFEYGYYVDGQKTGAWFVEDKQGSLIGQRTYINDSTEFEIQYRNGKIFSTILWKIGPWKKSESDVDIREGTIMEIVSFNKRGKIINRTIWKKGD